jgi:SPP1 family predicted phage head-tail adaptor
MRVSAGRLDQLITILQKTVERGALGGHDETWSPLTTIGANLDGKIKAEIVDMTGREIMQAKAMGSAVSQVITTRYYPQILNDMRVQFADGSFSRIQWVRHQRRKEFMELYCLGLDV